MRRISLVLPVVLAFVTPGNQATAQKAEAVRSAAASIVVRVNDQARPAGASDLVKKCGALTAEPLRRWRAGLKAHAVDLFFQVKFPNESAADRGLRCLEGLDRVSLATKDAVLEQFALPNDPLFFMSDHFRNIGQVGGTQDADIDAPEGWEIRTDASSQIVAVIDTGVAYNHLDLQANMWTNADPVNGEDDDGNGWIDDIHGVNVSGDGPEGDPHPDSSSAGSHGTIVASVIAAVGNNGIGMTGVAWSTKLMALRLNNAGSNLFQYATLITYAVDNGASIINISAGCLAPCGGPNAMAALVAAIDLARTQDVLVVAASGNAGVDTDILVTVPAALPADNVISVAATGPHDVLAPFSNFGLVNVDLAAPGVDIHGLSSDGTIQDFATGTSFAAPLVAGAAALVRAENPTFSYLDTRNQILSTVDPLPSLSGTTATGGRLNLARALGDTPTSIDPAIARYQSNSKSLSFDGAGDFLAIAPMADLLGSSSIGAFSVGFWLKMNETPAQYDGVAGATTNVFWADGVGFYWDSANALAFFVDSFTHRAVAGGLRSDQWNHIVGAYDPAASNDNVKIYVNGVAAASLTYTATGMFSGRDLEIGRLYDALPPLLPNQTRSSDANIDDFALWSRALTPTEVAAIFGRGAPGDPIRPGGGYNAAADLVGIWRLGDESNGPETRNVAEGPSATGAGTSVPTVSSEIPEPWRNVASIGFDGIDDAGIAPGLDAILGPTSNAFSVAFWFKGETTPQAWDGLLVSSSSALAMDGIGVVFDSTSSIRAWVGGSWAHPVVAATVDPLVWNHVVVAFDGTLSSSNVKLYLNGVPVSSADRSGSHANAVANLEVGRFNAALPPFFPDPNGRNAHVKIDEVSVWKRALAASEVAGLYESHEPRDVMRRSQLYVGQADLAAHWRMGDVLSGTTVPDLAGTHPLVLTEPGLRVPEVPWTNRYALGLDGVDEYLSIAKLDDLIGASSVNSFSLSLWAKMRTLDCLGFDSLAGSSATPAGWFGTVQDGFQLAWVIGQNPIGTAVTPSSFAFVSHTSPVDPGDWNHFLFVFDGIITTRTQLYVNGQPSSVASAPPGSVLLSESALDIGRNGSNFAAADGWIDEVALFDRGLTSSEAADLYSSGVPHDVRLPRGNYSPQGLRGYWRMGDGTTGRIIPSESGGFSGIKMGDELGAGVVTDTPSSPLAPVPDAC